jgi:ribonucleoside-diphosphate reductase alpha chain
MDAFAIAVSVGLQYGVPLEALVAKFTNMIFEPNGMTDDKDIRIAQSLVDYLARRLAIDYLDVETRHAPGDQDHRRAHRRGQRHRPSRPAPAEPRAAEAAPGPGPELQPGPAPAAWVADAGGRGPRPSPPGWPRSTPLLLDLRGPDAPAGSCFVCESCGTTSGCS